MRVWTVAVGGHGDVVRVAAFNILHGASPEDGRVDLDRLAGAVRRLDADVLALQEVDRRQPRSHLADLVDIATGATFPAHAPREQLDHVLGSPDLLTTASEVARLPLSDHRALVAEVR